VEVSSGSFAGLREAAVTDAVTAVDGRHVNPAHGGMPVLALRPGRAGDSGGTTGPPSPPNAYHTKKWSPSHSLCSRHVTP
jgi:hypothetical protein